MTHIGVISPTVSYLTTCFSLIFELQKRAHRISFLNVVDIQGKVLAANLELAEQLARQSFILFPKRFEPSMFNFVSKTTVSYSEILIHPKAR